MNLLDLTLPTPAENLACDEALLDWFEANGGDGVLRFWEPENYFVVVGYGNHVQTEVNVATCDKDGIPIFRRCSGGGTVLQGPGCLNYSLVLKVEEGGPLSSITAANRFIMERNREAVEAECEQRAGGTPAVPGGSGSSRCHCVTGA
jgi:lipoate-protein ligase A